MNEFTFGERIFVKARIERHRYQVDENDQIVPGSNYRRWARYEYPEPIEAIFLGKRTLADGKMKLPVYPEEEAPYFSGEKFIPGAWICIKGKNPEKVFLSDCIKILTRSVDDYIHDIRLRLDTVEEALRLANNTVPPGWKKECI